MRSRGQVVDAAGDRDLIEAGLSEPAGWRVWLWGLCRRRLIRDARSAVRRVAFDRPIAIGGSACEWLKEAGMVASSAIRAAAAANRMAAVLTDEAIPTGVAGVRGEYGNAVEREGHELSSQNRGR